MNTTDIQALQRLSDTLDILRRQCPWDRVQTMQTLRPLTIEETYELSEAILRLSDTDPSHAAANNSELKKELGDLFMHLLFYTKIAQEEGRFTPAQLFDAITDKLIGRHPFIFHPDDYRGESWEQIKMHEGRRSVLDGVPTSLPTLVKAVRLQEKASGIGVEPVLPSEAERPSPAATLPPDIPPTEESFGTLLFNLIHWAHDHGINADTALAQANQRFQQKVRQAEHEAADPQRS